MTKDLKMLTEAQIKGMKPAEIAAFVAAQAAALAAAQAAASAPRTLSLKVSEKNAVSLIGLNARFPVTLYAPQWLKVLDMADEIRAFIEANRAKLSWEKAKKV